MGLIREMKRRSIRLPKRMRIYMILKCLDDEENKYLEKVGDDMRKWWDGLTVPEILIRINKSWKIERKNGKILIRAVSESKDSIFSLSNLYKYVKYAFDEGYISYDWKEEYFEPVPQKPIRYKLTNRGRLELSKLP